MVKIYTKVGDKGRTQLIGGKMVSKANDLLDLYGGLDEMNSFIGLAVSLQMNAKQDEQPWQMLLQIQQWLFKLGAHMATPPSEREKYKIPTSFAEYTSQMENLIDSMTSLLPPLKNFILPGGSSSASALHTSRAVCRRIERKIVDFVETNPDEISDEILPFINRLSDFLFVSARYVNMKNNSKDVLVNV